MTDEYYGHTASHMNAGTTTAQTMKPLWTDKTDPTERRQRTRFNS